jgi:hypothetical protein
MMAPVLAALRLIAKPQFLPSPLAGEGPGVRGKFNVPQERPEGSRDTHGPRRSPRPQLSANFCLDAQQMQAARKSVGHLKASRTEEAWAG